MSVIQQFEDFYRGAKPKTQEQLDTIMKVFMLPEDEMSWDDRIRLASRIVDLTPDYASDAEVAAVRARFTKRAL